MDFLAATLLHGRTPRSYTDISVKIHAYGIRRHRKPRAERWTRRRERSTAETPPDSAVLGRTDASRPIEGVDEFPTTWTVVYVTPLVGLVSAVSRVVSYTSTTG